MLKFLRLSSLLLLLIVMMITTMIVIQARKTESKNVKKRNLLYLHEPFHQLYQQPYQIYQPTYLQQNFGYPIQQYYGIQQHLRQQQQLQQQYYPPSSSSWLSNYYHNRRQQYYPQQQQFTSNNNNLNAALPLINNQRRPIQQQQLAFTSNNNLNNNKPSSSSSSSSQTILPLAIESQRSWNYIHVEPEIQQLPKSKPRTIYVDSIPKPMTIMLKTHSTPITVRQEHEPSVGHYEETSTEEEPLRFIHTVHKPVIQEVREIIAPQRMIYREIYPVNEQIHTIISKQSSTTTAAVNNNNNNESSVASNVENKKNQSIYNSLISSNYDIDALIKKFLKPDTNKKRQNAAN